MTRAPQTIASEVAAGLNALMRKTDRFRDWSDPEVQAVVREAEKLKKAEPREAYVLLGGIAAICGLVDETFDYYAKAFSQPAISPKPYGYNPWI